MDQEDPIIKDADAQLQQAERADEELMLQRKALSAEGVHDALLLEGRVEINRTWTALAWSGFASGLTMSLTLMAQGVLRACLPDTDWRTLIEKLGYTFGFVAVTLGRQQLYTETTLTAALPFLHDKSRATLMLAGRLWVILLLSNLAGAYLIAAVMAHTDAFPPDLRDAFLQIGEEAAQSDFWTALVKGIFGGWMIALMVWLMPASGSAKVWVIMLITWLLAVTGLTHIIAGSLELFYLLTTGTISWSAYLVQYGIPVLIGNSIGGIVFVAVLNHAQVYPDKRRDRDT